MSPPAPVILVGKGDAGIPQDEPLNLHLPISLSVTDWEKKKRYLILPSKY